MPSLSQVLRMPVDIPTQLARDLTAIAEAVQGLPQLIAGLDTRLRSMSADLSAVRATADALETQVSTLTLDLGTVGRTVASADARVEALGVMVDQLALRVAHIDDGLDDRIPDLTPLPARVAHIDDGLEARIPDLSPLPEVVEQIARDVATVLERTPDPAEETGTLEKVRDALTPGD